MFFRMLLFSNTIDSNIAFSNPDVDERRVRECAKRAMADDFINELSDGYQTIVGEKDLDFREVRNRGFLLPEQC